MAKSEEFASIELVADVLVLFMAQDMTIEEINKLKIEDFADSKFFSSTKKEDIDMEVVFGLISASGVSSELISAVQAASVEISFVSENISLFIEAIVAEFDFFQSMSFDFFKTQFEDENELFLIAVAILTFDASEIAVGDFSTSLLNIDFDASIKGKFEITREIIKDKYCCKFREYRTWSKNALFGHMR